MGIPEGTYEEEHGRKGFYGKSAHLYHAHPPTGWIRFEGKLRPHLFDLNKLEPSDCTTRKGMPSHSSAMTMSALRLPPLRADAVLLSQRRRRRTDLRPSRQGTIETDFGPLALRERATT